MPMGPPQLKTPSAAYVHPEKSAAFISKISLKT